MLFEKQKFIAAILGFILCSGLVFHQNVVPAAAQVNFEKPKWNEMSSDEIRVWFSKRLCKGKSLDQVIDLLDKTDIEHSQVVRGEKIEVVKAMVRHIKGSNPITIISMEIRLTFDHSSLVNYQFKEQFTGL